MGRISNIQRGRGNMGPAPQGLTSEPVDLMSMQARPRRRPRRPTRRDNRRLPSRPMVTGGTETIFGVKRAPVFGPIVMFELPPHGAAAVAGWRLRRDLPLRRLGRGRGADGERREPAQFRGCHKRRRRWSWERRQTNFPSSAPTASSSPRPSNDRAQTPTVPFCSGPYRRLPSLAYNRIFAGGGRRSSPLSPSKTGHDNRAQALERRWLRSAYGIIPSRGLPARQESTKSA